MRRTFVLGALLAVGALSVALSAYQTLPDAALKALEIVKVKFAWKDAPFLDLKNGASGVEFPTTLAKAVAAFQGNVDTVIPGHHPVTPLKDLGEYQRFNADLLAAVQDAMKAGKNADEATASIDLTSNYPGYKSQRMKAAVDAIYAELKK